MGDRNWSAVDVCVAKNPIEKMVAVGEDGNVFTYVGGNSTDEIIEPKPITLRRLGTIDGFSYACGMKRQVYKRIDENKWIPMHAPLPNPNESVGFEAISGFSQNEIYAVGWNGEIWEWNGSTWLNHGSPTNLILTGVCCGDNQTVYICGQNGTIIRGRHDTWGLMEFEDIFDDFWDIIWFNNTFYVATMNMIFQLVNNYLIPVSFGDDSPRTCYRLTQAEDVLWSVGDSDIFAFDGTNWVRID